MTTSGESSELDLIGSTAGSVWQLLNANGPMKMSDLVKQVDCSRDAVMQAIGWLARENKITIAMKSRTRTVQLID